MKLGILGLGQMGEAILQGLRNDKSIVVQGTTISEELAQTAMQRLGIQVHTDNARLAQECDVILLAVKPYQAEKVLRAIAGQLTSKHLIISVAAAITTQQLEAWAGGRAAVIRAMPNTPAFVGEGMTALCAGSKSTSEHLKAAEIVFEAVGEVVVIPEEQMDAATAIHGCGPAYVYLMIEALSDGGVQAGLPRAIATRLAAQTLLGGAKMVLESGQHPAQLKDAVTTPGGVTIEGVLALERGKLRATLIEAVLAANARSKSLRGN